MDLAQVTLMTALGLKTWPFTQVEDVLEVKTQPQSLEELKVQAQQRRPEMLKNRHQQSFNEAAIQVARAGLFPRVHFRSRPMAGRVWISLLPASPAPGMWARR